MGLKDLVKKAAFVDILRGMSVTGTYFVVDKVTVEYPKEKLQTYPRFRGVHALLMEPDTGTIKCVACMLCATICPSGCIRITGTQTPEGRSLPETFDLDLSRCIFCGLCEEVCPQAAIVMTRHYELATYDKGDFFLDKKALIANQVYAHKELFVVEEDEDTSRPAGRDTRAGEPALEATGAAAEPAASAPAMTSAAATPAPASATAPASANAAATTDGEV